MVNPDPSDPDWQEASLLKADLFGSVSFGSYRGDPAIRREIASSPRWAYPIAKNLFERERRALARVGGMSGVPHLIFAGKKVLYRSYVDGLTMNVVRPLGDTGYFRAARMLLLNFHRLGLTHNDLAKEQNWLVLEDGRPGFIDFQLARHHHRRGRIFRLMAYEDLRHLLKHKRSYVPEDLTPRERKVLERKSLPSRIWRATGKRVYNTITRGVFKWSDAEGSGGRYAIHGQALAQRLADHADVHEAVVCAYPNRRKGEGIYAFVQADAGISGADLSAWAREALGEAGAPDIVQVVADFPRHANGAVRRDLLEHIARNLVGPVERALAEAPELAESTRAIMGGRLNLSDRA